MEMQGRLDQVFAKWERGPPKDRPDAAHRRTGGDTYRTVIGAGKQAWQKRFGDVGPAPRRSSHQRSLQPSRGISLLQPRLTSLEFFKVSPTVLPSIAKARPVMGCLCDCMTSSHFSMSTAKSSRDIEQNSEVVNLLKYDLSGSSRCALWQTFWNICESLKACSRHKYVDVTENLSSSPRLVEVVQAHLLNTPSCVDSSPSELREAEKRLRVRARRILRKTTSSISAPLVHALCWLLKWSLGLHVDGLFIRVGQLETINKAAQAGSGIVYVSTEESWLDQFLVSFAIVSGGLKAPYVIVENDRCTPIFRWFLRRLGAFLFSGCSGSLAGDVKQLCLGELVARGEGLVMFSRAARTISIGSDRLCHPALSHLVGAFCTGGVRDALLVPVSIGHDAVTGASAESHPGDRGHPVTFCARVVSACQHLRRRYGNIRIDFGQPFSLKEYVKSRQLGYKTVRLCEDDDDDDDDDDDRGVDSALYPQSPEQEANLVRSLSEHLAFDQLRTTSVMSTHMVAFLLLNKHRQGVRLDELVASFDWLRAELVTRGHDLGFTGQAHNAVLYATELLGGHLVVKHEVTTDDDKGEAGESYEFRMADGPAAALQLAAAAKSITTIFAVDAVIASVVQMLVLTGRRPLAGHLGEPTTLTVSRKMLLSEATHLSGVLAYHYALRAPCMSLENVLSDAIIRLVETDLLRPEEGTAFSSTQEKAIAQRLSQTCGFDDDEFDNDYTLPDTEYTVDVESEFSRDRLAWLRGLVAPTLEVAYVVACCLTRLLDADTDEEDFLTYIRTILRDRLHSGIASYPESVSVETVQNILRSFVHLHVIEVSDISADLKVISLHDNYYSASRLNEFIESLECYRL